MDIKFAYAGRGVWRGFNGSESVVSIFLNNLTNTYMVQLKFRGMYMLREGLRSLADAQRWAIAKGRILDGKVDVRGKKSPR